VTLRLRKENARRRVFTGEVVGDEDRTLLSELAVLLVEGERCLVSCSTSSSDTLAAGNEGAAASSRISRNFDDVIVICVCVCVCVCVDVCVA